MSAGVLERVAGAPITWGVCEVPGWGHQLDRERVLREMAAVGLRATELGPAGFLPDDPDALVRALARHGLRAVGAFVPVVLHDPARHDLEMRRVALASERLSACGADVCVVAASSGATGYEAPAELDDDAWTTLLRGLDEAQAVAAERGVVMALHPHAGTAVERAEHVDRVLHGSSARLCLDTGHLVVGGADPVALAREAPDRIAHVHLKDVDAAAAERVRRGDVGYRDAVAADLYRPLGEGDLDAAGLVRALEAAGFAGWYVLEHDVVLPGDPQPGEGPAAAAGRSLGFLRSVANSSDDGITLVGEGRERRTVRPPGEVKGGLG